SVLVDLEHPALREEDGLVVQRAVLESEDEPALDHIATRHLSELSRGQALALGRSENGKAVHHPFGEPNGNRCGVRQRQPRNECGNQPRAAYHETLRHPCLLRRRSPGLPGLGQDQGQQAGVRIPGFLWETRRNRELADWRSVSFTVMSTG